MSTQHYRFKKKVFKPPFTPFYNAYKGHIFSITHKINKEHAALKCVSDPAVKVDGYVDMDDIELVK